jgi:biotin carboxyl carrier protein
MKRLVDGVEIEFPEVDASIVPLGDRWLVRTASGSYSALAVQHEGAVLVSYKGRQYKVERPGRKAIKETSHASGELRAPMPGTVVSVNAKEGDVVVKGSTVLVIEAMKTQQPFAAPFDAVVERIFVESGQGISEGSHLAFLRPLADTSQRVSE